MSPAPGDPVRGSQRGACRRQRPGSGLGDRFAEFGDLPGDGDAVGRAVRISGDREPAALSIEARGRGTKGHGLGDGVVDQGEFQWEDE